MVYIDNRRNGCLSSCFMSFMVLAIVGFAWSVLVWLFHGWGLLVGVPLVLGFLGAAVASARRKVRSHAPTEPDVEPTEEQIGLITNLDERIAARRVRIDRLREIREAHRREG